MGAEHGFLTELRHINFFNHPLAKTGSTAGSNSLLQDDTRLSLELAGKPALERTSSVLNQSTMDWNSNSNFEKAKVSRTRSDDMMIEEQGDSKVVSLPFQGISSQNTLLSTQYTSSQLERSSSNFSGLLGPLSQISDSGSQSGFSNQISLWPGLSQGKTTPKPEIIGNKQSASKIMSPVSKFNDFRSTTSFDSQATTHTISYSKNVPNRKNFSVAKSESTYISGPESTPPHLRLECDESPGLLLSSAKKRVHFSERTTLPDIYEEELKIPDDTPTFMTRASDMQIEEIGATSILKEELDKFNSLYYNSGWGSEVIEFLVLREREYMPDPFFLEKKQRHITSQMRAVLLDWLMEVSDEFGLKRETFFYAMNYIDRYLAEVEDVPKNQFQLIGLTALHLAAKTEEIDPPKLIAFAQAAEFLYSIETIQEAEVKMLKALKWILTPPTINTWAQWYTKQWDLYTEKVFDHPLVIRHESAIQFRKETEKSYALYREMMQLIDCAILDVQTLQYSSRALTTAFMYLVLGKQCGVFTLQQITKEMPQSSLYLLNESSDFNALFGDFVSYCFEYSLPDLLPAVQYAATFFGLPMNYQMPSAVKRNKESVLDVSYDAFQTHNPKAVEFVKTRLQNSH